MDYGKNMMLFSSYWQTTAGDYQETFKLMPIKTDCPYSEAIFDSNTGMLVVISKVSGEKFQLVPTLNSLGDTVKASNRTNGKPFREQRVKINMATEHILIKKEEIFNFISIFCVNDDTFEYKNIVEDAINRRENFNK